MYALKCASPMEALHDAQMTAYSKLVGVQMLIHVALHARCNADSCNADSTVLILSTSILHYHGIMETLSHFRT